MVGLFFWRRTLVRNRGDNGRFQECLSGSRSDKKNFRATPATASKLQALQTFYGMSLGDVIEMLIEFHASQPSAPDLDQIKARSLKRFQSQERVGVQSSTYKSAKKMADLFAEEVKKFM
ncbi:hypothetical protein [Roseofilum casamattae]|uniref:Uncharacterized protein n=1 Tax=Roseofilum casamattae BLCC-M143 TaxID=3022442 RepID=A0ABT7C197_9CYAN|nr:hypothetical protein [Roseofilum casamattae]MDJ1184519.1 hypothetical protein [Roseofilum casamattae BLCC-M143]